MPTEEEKKLQAERQARAWKKAVYRGVEFVKIKEYDIKSLVALFNSRQRRRYAEGMHNKYERLTKKVAKSVHECPYGEKPTPVRTHLRNCIVTPPMVGGIVECYGGKYWNAIEVRAEMIGHYLAEFSLSYKPIRHGKVGVGATRSSKFTSLR
jgi:small subunit ribosomal protein S15e